MAQPNFNESSADKEVIRSLIRHIRKITKEKTMSIFRDSDGSIKVAIQFATVTREDLAFAFEQAKKNLEEYDALVESEKPAEPAPISQTEVPTTPEAAPVEAPAPEPVAPQADLTAPVTPEPTPVTEPVPAAEGPAPQPVDLQ